MKRFYITLVFGICFCFSAESQTLKAFLKAADEAVAERDFYNAMYYLGEAILFDTTDLDLKYQYAESANVFLSLIHI